jgi:membrane-bound metal-dependent hydrolase YbcI (DUF457 family)
MTDSVRERFDNVDRYYKPVKRIALGTTCLFWIIAALSLIMPYSTLFGNSGSRIVFQVVFIILVLGHFTLSQVFRLYFFPRAENARRKHLLSDAFGISLSHDRTHLYYNNSCTPSLRRLGADTFENVYFSKEITHAMLGKDRIIMAVYLLAWLLAFTLRHNDISVLTWITQVVFSGQIIARWMNLEVLHCRHERVYDRLHDHFLHEIGDNSAKAIANILDAFTLYESAKLSAGIVLSTKHFNRLNPSLSESWNRIRKELNIDSSS